MCVEERVRTESLKGKCCCQLVEEGDTTDQGNHRGAITVRLLDTLGKVFGKLWSGKSSWGVSKRKVDE